MVKSLEFQKLHDLIKLESINTHRSELIILFEQTRIPTFTRASIPSLSQESTPRRRRSSWYRPRIHDLEAMDRERQSWRRRGRWTGGRSSQNRQIPNPWIHQGILRKYTLWLVSILLELKTILLDYNFFRYFIHFRKNLLVSISGTMKILINFLLINFW